MNQYLFLKSEAQFNSEWCCNITFVSDSGFDWIMQSLKWLVASQFSFGDLSCSGSVAPLWQTLVKITSRDGLQSIKLAVKNKCRCVWALTSCDNNYSAANIWKATWTWWVQYLPPHQHPVLSVSGWGAVVACGSFCKLLPGLLSMYSS